MEVKTRAIFDLWKVPGDSPAFLAGEDVFAVCPRNRWLSSEWRPGQGIPIAQKRLFRRVSASGGCLASMGVAVTGAKRMPSSFSSQSLPLVTTANSAVPCAKNLPDFDLYQ